MRKFKFHLKIILKVYNLIKTNGDWGLGIGDW